MWPLLWMLLMIERGRGMAIDILDVTNMAPHHPNYCNESSLLSDAQLFLSPMGQFIGYQCSPEFFHCRWQSDGFYTYKKTCRVGLVYDTMGTQNCNYDYNVKGCSMTKGGNCLPEEFSCPLSESCLSMSKRCDGHYDCSMEEDEQNCPLCGAGQFACLVSEECIPLNRRCNGITECRDGSDEIGCSDCGEGQFLCTKSGKCISGDGRCNGIRQCPHGEDEILCKMKEKTFKCQSRDQHIPINQVCDGIGHCNDGSDEKYCERGEGRGDRQGVPPVQPILPPSTSSIPFIISSTVMEEEEEEEKNGPLFPVLSITFPEMKKNQSSTTTTTTIPIRMTTTSSSTPLPTLINTEIFELETTSSPTSNTPSTVSVATFNRQRTTSSQLNEKEEVNGSIEKNSTHIPYQPTAIQVNSTITKETITVTEIIGLPPLVTTTTQKNVTQTQKTVTEIPSTTTSTTRMTTTTTPSTTPSTIPFITTSTTQTTQDISHRTRYPTVEDSSEEGRKKEGRRKSDNVEPMNQKVQSLRDEVTQDDIEWTATIDDSLPVSTPGPSRTVKHHPRRILPVDDEIYPDPKFIVNADLVRRIGERLDLRAGKAISTRSLLSKIEQVLKEELTPLISSMSQMSPGRNARSFTVHSTVPSLPPLIVESLPRQPLSLLLLPSTQQPSSIKPRFSFKIL